MKEITLGQYYPSGSLIHRLDPRTKIVCVMVYIVALFLAQGWAAYLLLTAVTLLLMLISRISPKRIFTGLKPMFFIIFLTGILNIFYT